MSFSNALQYEQIWFLELNERRQTNAFNAVPRIVLLGRGRARSETI